MHTFVPQARPLRLSNKFEKKKNTTLAGDWLLEIACRHISYRPLRLVARDRADLSMASKWFHSTKNRSEYWLSRVYLAAVRTSNSLRQPLEPISKWHDHDHSKFEQCAHDIGSPNMMRNVQQYIYFETKWCKTYHRAWQRFVAECLLPTTCVPSGWARHSSFRNRSQKLGLLRMI